MNNGFWSILEFELFNKTCLELSLIQKAWFAQPDINEFSESEVKWRVAMYGDPYSEFVLCI